SRFGSPRCPWSLASCSRCQPPVQFVEDFGQPVAEEVMHPTQPAKLAERSVLEVLFVDPQAPCDVVTDRIEPLPLIGCEHNTTVLLLSEPLPVSLLDRRAKRDDRRRRVDRMPHKCDEVRQVLAALALYGLGLDRFVRLPNPLGRG